MAVWKEEIKGIKEGTRKEEGWRPFTAYQDISESIHF